MTHSEARIILEAMADGCDPLTGEALPMDHLLLDESVMEALLIALEALHATPENGSKPAPRKPVKTIPLPIDFALPDGELMEAVELYRALATNPTANRIAALLCGAPAVKDAELKAHPLFGRYASHFQKAQIVPWLEEWMVKNNIVPPKDAPKELHPYFNEPHFNKLSDKAVQQLKEKVVALPITKTEDLSEHVIERRLTLPRYQEPWPEEEIRLLKIATEFTNDLAFLGECFGRSPLALSAQAEKWLSV